MPTPIIFTITTAGRVAALDAFDNGLTIALTEIGIGDDSYTPTGAETALSNELDRFNLSGGTVESLSATLRFSAAITALARTEVYEIGLFSSTGVLFAVASTTSTTVPLTVAEANIDTICAFGMVLGDVPASSLTITIDPSAPLAIQLVNQHIGAANPHPQYAMNADLLTLSDDLDDEVFAREAADVAMAITIAGKAALAGSNSQIFNAANGVSGKNVVNKEQLDAKAEKNGSSTQVFSVAAPTLPAHAVRNEDLLAYLPSGVVVPFAGSFIPTGWLECNGAAVSRATYSLLFAAIGTLYGIGDGGTTFNLPDLRGEFLRGYDNGRGVDTGRVVASAQTDEIKAHNHTANWATYNENGSITNHMGSGGATPDDIFNLSTENSGGTETRPRNIAMYHIIRT